MFNQNSFKQRILFTKHKDVSLIVNDLKNQIGNFVPKLLLLFSSSNINGSEMHKEMKKHYPNTIIMGSSSYGEIANGEMLKDTVVGMALTEEIVGDIKLEVVQQVKEDIDANGIKNAFISFGKHFNEPSDEMNYKKYVGMVITDFASLSEEKVLDKIGDMTNVVFVGGSSADDWQFAHTEVYAEGEAFHNTVLLLLMKPNTEFSFIKTQSFKATEKKFIATKVEPETRSILELNHRPAGDIYAECLGVSVEEVPNHFSSNPFGVVIGEEIYVRSPIDIKKDKITFVSNTPKGVEVTFLQSTNIIEDTKQAVKSKIMEMGGEISALINFNCTLRTKELEAKSLTKEYGEIFKDLPAIGFSTYGESYLGHINQTATMIVFK